MTVPPDEPLPEGQVWVGIDDHYEPRGTGLVLPARPSSCQVCGVRTAGASRCIAHPAGPPATRG